MLYHPTHLLALFLPPPHLPDTGARVVVGHAAFGEMALHFIEKHGMMAVRIPSKFELRRFCRATGAGASGAGAAGMGLGGFAAKDAGATACINVGSMLRTAQLAFPVLTTSRHLPPCASGATSLVKLQAPAADELGYARSLAVQASWGAHTAGCRSCCQHGMQQGVMERHGEPLAALPGGRTSCLNAHRVVHGHDTCSVSALVPQEIGGTKCLVLQQDSSQGQISTVVLRGSTDQVGRRCCSLPHCKAWMARQHMPCLHQGRHRACGRSSCHPYDSLLLMSMPPCHPCRRCWTTLSARWMTA